MKIENKEVDIDADVNQISGNPINEQYYSFNEKIEFLCSFFLLPFPLFMNSNKKFDVIWKLNSTEIDSQCV